MTARLATQKKSPKPTKRARWQPKRKDSRTIQQWTRALSSSNGKLNEVFPAWSDYLHARRRVPTAGKLVGDAKRYLFWGVPPEESTAAAMELVGQLMSAKRMPSDSWAGQAMDWSAERLEGSLSPAVGLEALGWATLLARCPEALTPDSWSEILHQLLNLASFHHGMKAGGDVWVAQLLGGELALTLAYYFPELPACDSLAREGGRFVSKGLVELLDGTGMPAASHLDVTRKLLASWTRSLCMADRIATKKTKLVSYQARMQYSWLVRQALRLTRGDGRHAFDVHRGRKSRSCDGPLFALALRLIDDRQDRALARLVLDTDELDERRLPPKPAYQSDWGGVAVMQPDWSPRQPRLVVVYGDNHPRIELTNRGQLVASGPWVPEISIDGSAVHVASDWECVCWFTDHDVDFMELEATLSNGWTLQRQALMARQDQFLWMADVLLGDAAATMDYRLDLSLPQDVEFRSADEATEGRLVGRKPLALVCAPSLPEWKSACRESGLQAAITPHALRVTHRVYGRAAYFPLFFDLHRRRMSQPVTWRQLTVAEQLEIVGRDVAAGFRVHVGIEQWIFYRSLTPDGNRTLIGQNYASEFVCGRFLNDGDVEPLVEVEASRE